MTAHDDWASYLDPDTPPESRSELAAQLGAGETAALDRIGGLLADEAVWGEPSAGLRDSLMAQVRAEQDTAADATTPPPFRSAQQPGAPGDELAERRSRRRLGMLGGGLVAAAAAVAVFMFAVRPAGNPDVTTYELAATELTPDLDATVDVLPLPAGVAITLHIKGLPPAEEGTYYAAWLMPEMDAMGDDTMTDDSMTPMVGVGSFHWREGGIPIELWSGVDTDRFPMFMVTLQNENDPPVASDIVVMTGRLTGS